MARLAQTVVAEREALAFQQFKQGTDIESVNALLLEKYGTKMSTGRLYEVRKAAHAEVFAYNSGFGNDLHNEIDLLKKQNASLASEVSFAQNKVRELEEQIRSTPSSAPNDLDDLAQEMRRNRELAVEIDKQYEIISDLEADLANAKEDKEQAEAKIVNLQEELDEIGDTISDLEGKLADANEASVNQEEYEKFAEEICDVKKITCIELKEAIRSGNLFQAMKIIGIAI